MSGVLERREGRLFEEIRFSVSVFVRVVFWEIEVKIRFIIKF